MAFAFLPFPYLSAYALTTQFGILTVLLALSYRYRRPRLALLAALVLYTAWKTAPPLARWGFVAVKAVAWFGFYVHFFIVGVGYVVAGAAGLWNSPELLQSFIDSLEGRGRS
ncbi:hypothetical protein B0H15DRAFT_806129 [Mycena belliarum]|uniref:Uncharacterized protein n=1 Tax=Mycena belliarum TaxID=1033014 RepID=A0AAD6TQM4_9AGAR|nr:hypothetical protein B0H15DRAFT_806129 [Mycena belliae]